MVFSLLLTLTLYSVNVFGQNDELNHDMSIPAVRQDIDAQDHSETQTATKKSSEAAEIPFWRQADYIIEASDVITLRVDVPNLSDADLEPINQQHLVDPDGYITLGKYGRVFIDGLTPAECDEAIHYHLTKPFGKKDFKVETSVNSCNSKEYHVVFVSPSCGQQQLRFPYLGHTTVLDALSMLNSEDEVVLPEGTDEHFVVLRSNKEGKAIEMISVNLKEAFADLNEELNGETISNVNWSKNVIIKPGDTILLTQEFQGEDIRPDGEIVSGMNASESSEMQQNEDVFAQSPAADNDFGDDEYAYQDRRELLVELLQREPVLADFETKTADQFNADMADNAENQDPSGFVAKTVFFDGERFPLEGFGELDALQQTIQPNTSISFVVQKQPAGLWLILYGEKEIVEQLYDVFNKIATESK